jgi:putative aminopeptidase FrvX
VDSNSLQFLTRLLEIPGPSSEEKLVSRIWRDEVATFADEVRVDVSGNSFALLKNGKLTVLLAAHIDEIGIMVSHIDDEGFLYFLGIGLWDPYVLVGQRVRLLGKDKDVIGVIGRKPAHLLKGEDKKGEISLSDLWIDIGVKNRSEALDYVSVGAVGVMDAALHYLPNDRLVSRCVDNRVGVFTILEILRNLAVNRCEATIAAVTTTQEEILQAGAQTAAFGLDPQIAIIVDMTYATDHPQSDLKRDGDVRIGAGPVLSRGSANHPILYDMLVEIAERKGIHYSLQVTPSKTSTDADSVFVSRSGVATILVTIPCRYMHSPNELVELSDIEDTIELITTLIRSLGPEMDFLPR